MGVGFNDFIDHASGQLANLYTVCSDCRRRSPLMHALLFCLICHISSCEHTGMGKLQRRNSSMAADRIRCVGSRCKGIEDALIQMVSMGAVCCRVNHQFGYRYGRRTASRAKFIEGS